MFVNLVVTPGVSDCPEQGFRITPKMDLTLPMEPDDDRH